MSERESAALPTSIFSVLGHLFGQPPSSNHVGSVNTIDGHSKKKRRRSGGGRDGEVERKNRKSDGGGGGGGGNDDDADILIDEESLEDKGGSVSEKDGAERQYKRLKEHSVTTSTTTTKTTTTTTTTTTTMDAPMEHKVTSNKNEMEVVEGENSELSSQGRREGGHSHAPSQSHHVHLNPHAVYVTGLSFSTVDPACLTELFSSRFGPVKEARVAVKDGKGRGFGYVLFVLPTSASECLRKCSETLTSSSAAAAVTSSSSSSAAAAVTSSSSAAAAVTSSSSAAAAITSSSSSSSSSLSSSAITTTIASVDEVMKGEGEQVEVLKLDGRKLQVQACRRELIDKWHVPALPPKPVLIKTATITSFKPRGFARVKVIESSAPAPAASSSTASTVKSNEINNGVYIEKGKDDIYVEKEKDEEEEITLMQ
jgi:hypothetical protein